MESASSSSNQVKETLAQIRQAFFGKQLPQLFEASLELSKKIRQDPNLKRPEAKEVLKTLGTKTSQGQFLFELNIKRLQEAIDHKDSNQARASFELMIDLGFADEDRFKDEYLKNYKLYQEFLDRHAGQASKPKKGRNRISMGFSRLAQAGLLGLYLTTLTGEIKPTQAFNSPDNSKPVVTTSSDSPWISYQPTQEARSAATATVSPTKPTPEASPTPEKVDSFQEVMKPFIQEAMKRRAERADKDPEYSKRVDKELNSHRINFVIYGYGETLENPPENPNLEKGLMGSQSIFSYNLLTQSFDIISLTHDIRAPENEKYLKDHGKDPIPTKIDGAYHIGGFPLQALAIEDATGFSIDFQMAIHDQFIKEMVDKVFGNIKVDVPFDIDTYPFYQDGIRYGAGHFNKGVQGMDGMEAMQFLKAWSKSHSPDKERNVRKHIFLKALLKEIFANKTNLSVLWKGYNLLRDGQKDKKLDADFDPLKLLLKPSTILNIKTKPGEEPFKIKKTLYLVDPYSGGPENGVNWITRSKSPQIQKDLKAGMVKDPTFVVPVGENVNPYAKDLVKDYWGSSRGLIKQEFSDSATQTFSQSSNSLSAVQPTPEATPMPEKINLSQELLKPFIEEAKKRRAERATKDPEYERRVDRELNENRINILIYTYWEEHGNTYDDVRGAPTILSYNLTTNTIESVSLSRDIRVPEIEQSKTKDSIKFMGDVYRRGGFELLRKITERATGLSIDYELKLKDVTIKKAIDQITGPVTIDVPKDHDTGPFRFDGKDYPGELINKGIQEMDSTQAIQFILAEDKNPDGKQDERSYRKNMLMNAINQTLKERLIHSSLIERVNLLNQISMFLKQEFDNKEVEADFDTNLIWVSLKGGISYIGRYTASLFSNQKAEFSLPEQDNKRQFVIHDQHFGDGGVIRLHNIIDKQSADPAYKPIMDDMRNGVIPGSKIYALIPDNGNPYAQDLISGYWDGIRKRVKSLFMGKAS